MMDKINIEKKLRYWTIEKGLTRAKGRLEADIYIEENDDKFQEKVSYVNSSICELLFWVNANDEWHCKNRNEGNSYSNKRKGVSALLGLKHAYNASKHEMSYLRLFRFEGTKEFIKGSGYQLEDISTAPIWIDCPDASKRKYINQVKNYRKYLKGREVLPTFNEAITFLNLVNAEYLFDK